MSIFEPANPIWTSRMLAVFRIVGGLLLLTSGTTKLLHYPPSPVPMPPMPLTSQIGFGALLEIIGGLLIILGLFTRPAAFILSGEMAVAYFQFHAPRSFFPTVNMGIPAILLCFLFLYLVFAGPGSWSVDGLIARARGGSRRG